MCNGNRVAFTRRISSPGDFVVGVTDPQTQQQPVAALVVEAFGTGQ